MIESSAKTRLMELLSVTAEDAVPNDLDLWPGVRSRLEEIGAHRSWRNRFVRTRAGKVALLGLLVTALAGASFAIVPAVTGLFRFTESLQIIDELGLVQEINLSQTRDGYTVTLERAYADTNVVLIAYSIENPPDEQEEFPQTRTVANYETTLTLNDGTALPGGVVGFGVRGSSDILGVSQPDWVSSNLLIFDAWPVPGAADVLELRFSVHVSEWVVPTGQVTKDAEARSLLVPTVAPLDQNRVSVGLFEFEFILPIVPGLEMTGAPRTIVDSGIPVTLERVVATPYETKVTVRLDSSTFDTYYDDATGEARLAGGSVPTAVLKASDGRSRKPTAIREEKHVWAFYFNGSLEAHPGEWKLTVSAVNNGAARVLPEGAPPILYLDEPVTFNFEMAPATD